MLGTASTPVNARQTAENAAPPADCPACGSPLVARSAPWLRQCPRCRLWRSTLSGEDRLQASAALDETRRVEGLRGLRAANYARTLAALHRVRAGAAALGGRLLDVGCGYGWFLDAAAEAGLEPVGVEPDEGIAAAATARGHRVWTGYFPQAVPAGERFDVVAFNDVLEHFVDVHGALAGAARCLVQGGVLLVSAPDGRGALMKAGVVLARLGRQGLLDRLWQRGFPSPHISYFGRESLELLGAAHGFQLRHAGRLRSLELRGSWARLHMDRRPSLSSFCSYLLLLAGLPLLRLLPSDQMLAVFELSGGRPGRGV